MQEGPDANEFACDTRDTPQKSVSIEIKSNGEILEHAQQAKSTQTKEDISKNETRFYGDLATRADRKVRPFQERIWATDKKSVARTQFDALVDTKEEMDAFLIVGINGSAAYALQAHNNSAVEALKQFKAAHAELERFSLQCYLEHAHQSVQTNKQAKAKLDWIQSLLRQDPDLENVLKRYETLFKAKMAKLPDSAKEVQVKVAQRPGGGVAPDIVTTRGSFIATFPPPSGNEEEASSQFQLWHLSFSEKTPKWAPSAHLFKVKKGFGVPLITLSDSFAVLVSPSTATILEASVYRIGAKGMWSKSPLKRVCFELTPDVFGTQGQLASSFLHPTTHMYAMAIGRGAIVFNASSHQEDEEAPYTCVIHKSNEYERTISAVTLGGKNMILLGTTVGECFGIDYTTGLVPVTEVVPACEPILSITYSNLRTIMHTVSAVSGTFNPYDYDGLRQIETPRPRDVKVCGTLLFSLDKYGALYIYSTVSAGITFPFKAPKELSIGMEYPCQVAYPGVYVTPTVVAAVYPNGLVQRFEIDAKMQRMIEAEAFKTKKDVKRQLKKAQKKKINKK